MAAATADTYSTDIRTTHHSYDDLQEVFFARRYSMIATRCILNQLATFDIDSHIVSASVRHFVPMSLIKFLLPAQVYDELYEKRHELLVDQIFLE